MLKLAIQKSGRLHAESMQLLKSCGLHFNILKRKLYTEANNFPLQVLFLRNNDIPKYVQDGVVDIGIVGQNTVLEKECNLETYFPLGFGKCRFVLAISKDIEYKGLSYFEGKSVATSHPNILKNFFTQNKINAEIHHISGSVEISTSIGLSEAICDLVQTGNTLYFNGLKEVETVIYSQALLIVNSCIKDEKNEILQKLLFRIDSVQKAITNKYIILNAPVKQVEAIKNILPGLQSPTLVPLANKNWVAVHSVIEENLFWNKIDQLKNLGAEGILVIPIEKMII